MSNFISYSPDGKLHLVLTKQKTIADSVELNPDMTAELNEQGEIIGIEILNASTFIRDYILESPRLNC